MDHCAGKFDCEVAELTRRVGVTRMVPDLNLGVRIHGKQGKSTA